MRIRTLTDLNDYLNEELRWRRSELIVLKALVDTARPHQRPTVIRVGLCLLYAHWEGFVKQATSAYLDYVVRQGLNLCDLTPNIVAIALRSRLRAVEPSNRITVHTHIAALL